VKGLLALLSDPESFVRYGAAAALGKIGDSSGEVVKSLLALLSAPESSVRSRAAAALGKIGDSSGEVVKGLLALLSDPEDYVRSRAAAALGQIGDSAVLASLIDQLQNFPDDNIPPEAIDLLRQLIIAERN
jgi:HEAT repeat protein